MRGITGLRQNTPVVSASVSIHVTDSLQPSTLLNQSVNQSINHNSPTNCSLYMYVHGRQAPCACFLGFGKSIGSISGCPVRVFMSHARTDDSHHANHLCPDRSSLLRQTRCKEDRRQLSRTRPKPAGPPTQDHGTTPVMTRAQTILPTLSL